MISPIPNRIKAKQINSGLFLRNNTDPLLAKDMARQFLGVPPTFGEPFLTVNPNPAPFQTTSLAS